jgi:hypothetical protein
MDGFNHHDDWAFLPKKTPVCGWDRRRKAKSREPISEVKDISMTECELQSSCPYYEGLIDMPEEYKEQYCRNDYQWCGRYQTYIAVEKTRKVLFTDGQGVNYGNK